MSEPVEKARLDSPSRNGRLAAFLAARSLVHSDLLLLPLLGSLTVVLLITAWLSLRWRLHYDVIDMQYVGFLIGEHGRVPYRDVFDPNMPATFLFHTLLTKLVGHEEPGARLFDVAYLALTCAAACLLLRPFDWRARWLGTLLYAWWYLCGPVSVLLQRDYLIVLPIAAALLIGAAPGRFRDRPGLRMFAAGLVAGLAVAVKPQAVLFLFVLAIGRRLATREGLPPIRLALAAGRELALALAGAAVAPAISLAWLAWLGGLPAFLDVVQYWWPLHTRMYFSYWSLRFEYDYDGEGIWLERRIDLLWLLWKRKDVLIAAAAMAVALAMTLGAHEDSAARRRALWIAAFAATAFVSVMVIGQSFDYVWQGTFFFVSLGAAAALHRPTGPQPAGRWARLPALVALAAMVWFGANHQWPLVRQWGGYVNQFYPERQVPIGDFLKARLKPGDKVQLMDWFGGGMGGLYRARADIANRFYIDYQFQLHPNSPASRALQAEFFAAVAQHPPRFIVRVLDRRNRFRLDGADARAWADFSAHFEDLLRRDYVAALEGDGFVILERRADAPRD